MCGYTIYLCLSVGKIPIKKSKLRRKRRHTDVDTDSSDDDKGRSRTKPTKKRHKRRDGEVIVAGSDADISCSDDEAPYKRGDVSGLGGLSFLSFLPLRGDSMEFFNPNFPRWDYQTRPHFPVIPHKPKGTCLHITYTSATTKYNHCLFRQTEGQTP